MSSGSIIPYSSWEDLIRTVPDFPSKGIKFRDITPVLEDAGAFNEIIHQLGHHYIAGYPRIDKVVAIESRGFLFGAALAFYLRAGLALVRKPGKLPSQCITQQYELEYGSGFLELHRDAIRGGDNIVIIDDILATGGTARAAAKLVERLGGVVVECAFIIELSDLGGRAKLEDLEFLKVFALHSMKESD